MTFSGQDGAELRGKQLSMVTMMAPIAEHRLLAVQETDLERRFIPRDGLLAPCNATYWCEHSVTTLCAKICARGSVEVPAWLDFALRTQNKLSLGVPLCRAQLLGTHNSAITLADGYGLRDPYYSSVLARFKKWTGGPTRINTANQVFSLTDQMRLGARFIEIDVHYVAGALRIAHCGHVGIDVAALNLFLRLLQKFASLLHTRIRWAPDMLGCNPSLSGIPATDQRLYSDALNEIREWADMPENRGEFVVIYVDTDTKLEKWGLIPRLESDTAEALGGPGKIWTPVDRKRWAASRNLSDVSDFDWPSMGEMRGEGRRFLLLVNADLPLTLAFRKYQLCGWWESNPARLVPYPACTYGTFAWERRRAMSGHFIRLGTCALQYGPLNCAGDQGPGLYESDTAALQNATRCGINALTPDMLDLDIAERSVWSWAPAEPAPLFDPRRARTYCGAAAGPFGCDPLNCTLLSASDGRWRTVPCPIIVNGWEAKPWERRGERPTACRAPPRLTRMGLGPTWALGWGGTCPQKFRPSVPLNGLENSDLQAMAAGAGVDGVYLPIHGPEWRWRDEE